MLTTNDLRMKERKPAPDDEEKKQVKLKIITTNETHPKGFNLKGKGKPRSNRIITTGNIGKYQEIRKKQLVKKKADAKIRQKKLDDKIKMKGEKK